MGDTLDILNSNPVGAAAGAILGLGLGGINDKRQINQQQKLTNMQLEANKAMAKFNMDQSMDMWNKTNYGAQMEHLKAAGLNPALLYGMKGGGGVTTAGAGTGAGIGGGQAPHGGGEIMGLMMMKAQMENIKADTEKKKVETTKTAGVDTDLAKVQVDIAGVQREIMTQTVEEAKATITLTMQKAHEEWTKQVRENAIGQETYETQIKQVQENLVQTGLENALLKSNVKMNNAKITQISNEIAQNWKQLTINEQQLFINRDNQRSNEQNALSNERNADTNRGHLRLQELLNNMTASDKATIDVIRSILGASIIGAGAAMKPKGGGITIINE